MKPISLEQAQHALATIVMVMGCKKPDEATSEAYCVVLMQYPYDLLRKSLMRAVSRETWHKLPTPGALVKDAEAGMEKRRELLARVAVAQRRIEMAEVIRARQRP